MAAESHTRSILKAVSYRIFGTTTTFFISLLFTNDAVISGSIAVVETVAKTVLYYVHERLWNIKR